MELDVAVERCLSPPGDIAVEAGVLGGWAVVDQDGGIGWPLDHEPWAAWRAPLDVLQAQWAGMIRPLYLGLSVEYNEPGEP